MIVALMCFAYQGYPKQPYKVNAFMKHLRKQWIILVLSLFFTALAYSSPVPIQHIEDNIQTSDLTPEQALAKLQRGNANFLAGKPIVHDLLKQAAVTQHAQYPYAVILSCMDSRSSPELIFNQGIGDIFSLRVAGNVLNEDELGSLEYGTVISSSKVIVVMGHSDCNDLKGACRDSKLGHLTPLFAKIKPAIVVTGRAWHGVVCDNPNFINAAAKENVLLVMGEIVQQSSILKQLIAEKKIMLVGAMYDLATGKVTFFQFPKTVNKLSMR